MAAGKRGRGVPRRTAEWQAIRDRMIAQLARMAAEEDKAKARARNMPPADENVVLQQAAEAEQVPAQPDPLPPVDVVDLDAELGLKGSMGIEEMKRQAAAGQPVPFAGDWKPAGRPFAGQMLPPQAAFAQPRDVFSHSEFDRAVAQMAKIEMARQQANADVESVMREVTREDMRQPAIWVPPAGGSSEWLLKALTKAHTEGVPRRPTPGWTKERPEWLQNLLRDPELTYNVQKTLEEMGISEFAPWGQDDLPLRGAEQVTFNAGDRVVKFGDPQKQYSRPLPAGIWGVNPTERAWVASTTGTEDTPGNPGNRVLVAPRQIYKHPIWGVADYNTAEILGRAIKRQGFDFGDGHAGNVMFMAGDEYRPIAVDGEVDPTPGVRRVQYPFQPPIGPDVPYGWLLALLTGGLAAGLGGRANASTITPPQGLPEPPQDDSETPASQALPAGSPDLSGPRAWGAAPPLSFEQPEPAVRMSKSSTRPFSSGFEGMLRPPLWMKDYLPRPVQEIAYQGFMDPRAGGSDTPLVKPVRDFVIEGTPEIEEFQKRADAAMFQNKVMRGEDGTLLTPAEYLENIGRKAGFREEELPVLLTKVSDYLSGRGRDEQAAPVARQLLAELKAQSVGGEKEVFPGQTEQQREARRQSPAQESRYMTSAGMQQNLNVQKTLNILSALEESPELRPDYTTVGSALQGAISTGLSPVATISSAATGEALDMGDAGAQTRHLGYLRNVLSAANPAEARVKEALYWDDLASKQPGIGQYRTSGFGGLSPQTSWTTVEGMGNQAESDKANYLTYAEKIKDQAFSGTNILGSNEDAAMLRRLNAMVDREVPIVPEGVDPKRIEGVRDRLREYQAGRERRMVNEYPLYQEKWNQMVSPLGRLGDSLKVEQKSFPSPAWNNLAMAPKYWADIPSLATLGVGGLMNPRALLSRRALGTLAGEFMRDQVTTEQPYAAAMYASDAPYNTQPSRLFSPMESGDVTKEVSGPDGQPQKVPVSANDPDYPKHFDAWESGQRKLLEGLLKDGKELFPLPKQAPAGVGAFKL